MKIRSVLALLLMLSTFWYCSEPGNSENKPFHVDFDNNKLSVDLKLSDLIEDCKLVALETTEESLFGGVFQVINLSGDYIIIADFDNVYKFSSEGKFINKVLKKGRGPGEISGSCRYVYDNKRNILYFEDDFMENDFIRRYDMKSEKFMPSIKKCFTGRWFYFTIYQDSLIMASIEGLSRGETNPYALFIQNFKGELLDGINSNRTFIFTRPDNTKDIILQRLAIYKGDENIHVKYRNDDTLFTLENNKLLPYLIPDYKGKPTLPNFMPFEGDRNTYYDQCENPNFLILQHSLFTGWTSEGSWSRANYKKDYFLLDKSSGKYGLIRSYYDDFNGKKYNLGRGVSFKPGVDKEFPRPKTSPDGLIYITYYPTELPEAITNNSFRQLTTQIENLSQNLNETDNLVFLIAKPKKKLKILN